MGVLERSFHPGTEEAQESGMQTGQAKGYGMCMRAAAVGTEKEGKRKEILQRQTMLSDAE